MSEQQEILEAVRNSFVKNCTVLPKPQGVEFWTDARKARIFKQVKKYGLETIENAFKKVNKSPFLCGKNKRAWKANFDWIMKPDNFQKIMEGNYDPQEQVSKSSFDLDEAVRKATFSVGKGC